MTATNWTIDALKVGELHEVPTDILHFEDRSGRLLEIPLTIFVLRSGSTTIVVDTGGPADQEYIRRHHGPKYVRTSEMDPRQRLAEIGVRAEDVGLVVNTHLHWDHCSNNDLFIDAPVVVQRAELEYAVHPRPAHRSAYGVLPEIVPPWAASLDRVQAVDGPSSIAPGVDIVPLPGHTPGSQGVTVSTSEGTYVITGDCLPTMENWADGDADAPRPSGSFTDLPDFYRSLTLLKERGWVPLPSHDAAVVERGRFGG